jgi:hypothetical protein
MTDRAVSLMARRMAAALRPTRLATVVLALVLSGPAADPAHAQTIDDSALSIHGFLTQGWARAWGNPVAGIATGGSTFDYRSVAIQTGYRFGDADKLVLQLRHRRIGNSLIEGADNHVRLDWGFYERRFGEGGVRVGKVPLPRGFYNEIRAVGTALPFYRAPLHYYLESAETLEGIVAGYRFWAEEPWSVQAELYGGQYDAAIIINRPTGPVLRVIDARSVLGGQLWLDMPVVAARVGIGGNRYDETGGTGTPLSGSTLWQVSGEMQPGPFTLRGELERASSDEYEFQANYYQLGFALTSRLTLTVQSEYSYIDAPTLSAERIEQAHDHAVGIAWTLSPNTVVKLEGHRFKGFGVDNWHPYDAPMPKARYAIASLAVGF